jgi:pimeloyl-ACP methyl ester carboxylesterase
MDAVALLDGLGIERFPIVGHDWGSNIAEALAIGWPHRVDTGNEGLRLPLSKRRIGGIALPVLALSRMAGLSVPDTAPV